MGGSPLSSVAVRTLRFNAADLQAEDCLARLQSTLACFELEPWQLQELKLIVAELFSNALEHGVLGLNSQIKHVTQGFAQYLHVRKERLLDLESGYIEFQLQLEGEPPFSALRIQVKDSGGGFDFARWKETHDSAPERLHGRGLLLISLLVAELRFEEAGSLAVVVYPLSTPAPE